MSKLIDAETVVHWESYDDESETVLDHTGTIADFLDIMTYEGCPESVDAVPVVRCGECNFWDRDHISCEGLAKCLTGESGIRYRNRDDYCSRGRTEGL